MAFPDGDEVRVYTWIQDSQSEVIWALDCIVDTCYSNHCDGVVLGYLAIKLQEAFIVVESKLSQGRIIVEAYYWGDNLAVDGVRVGNVTPRWLCDEAGYRISLLVICESVGLITYYKV